VKSLVILVKPFQITQLNVIFNTYYYFNISLILFFWTPCFSLLTLLNLLFFRLLHYSCLGTFVALRIHQLKFVWHSDSDTLLTIARQLLIEKVKVKSTSRYFQYEVNTVFCLKSYLALWIFQVTWWINWGEAIMKIYWFHFVKSLILGKILMIKLESSSNGNGLFIVINMTIKNINQLFLYLQFTIPQSVISWS